MMGSGFHFEEGASLFTMNGQDIPVILALMVAALAAEVFLALKEGRRPGLVLPGLWLLWTLAQLAVRVAQVLGWSSLPAMGRALAAAFAVENIPTLLLLAAYGLCRLAKGRTSRRQLDKTRISDL